MIYQKAAAGLNDEEATELALAMGLIDQKSYDALVAIRKLRENADKDGDGIITKAEEMAAKYNVAIALELPLFKPSYFEIKLDDQQISTEAMLIAVGNGSSYGGGMRVCPDASLNDGLFDVMILKPVSKLEFIKVFPTVYLGKHIDHPKVNVYRTSKISISSRAIAYADGERIGALPISAECVPNAGLTWKN